LLGELARRQSRLEVAIPHFEAALKIDGPGAIDELPLGLCLTAQNDAAQRLRGLGLLEKWSGDPEWGATALRFLLEDAVHRDARPAMLKWAVALRVHPRCTFGDVPRCLQALAAVDESKFEEELLRLEQAHRASPEASAQKVPKENVQASTRGLHRVRLSWSSRWASRTWSADTTTARRSAKIERASL